MKPSVRHLAIVFFSAIWISASLSSCKSVRQPTGYQDQAAGGLRNASDARVELRSMLSSYRQWEKMRVPLTLRLSKPKSISVSGTATFNRNKSIFISLKYFGFEIANIYATADSVIVVDKFNKQYAAESIGRFLSDVPFTMANLQDLLTGRIFCPGKKQASTDSFSQADITVTTPQSWTMVPGDAPSGIEYGFSFNPADDLRGMIVRSGNHQPVTVGYDVQVITPYGPMSPEISVSYSTAKTSIDASIEWNLDKARWNKDVDLREPVISSKYRRITTEEITRMLSKL